MSLAGFLRGVLYIAAALAVLITLVATIIVFFMWPWLRPPSTHRFPIPPEATLTEAIAVEVSRKALAAEGEDTARMRPIPYDDERHFFAVNTIDSDSGSIRWSTPHGTYYGVRVEKKGSQVVCQVYRLK